MISAKPNTPIATTTKPMPSESSGMSNAMRDCPVSMSEPTIESSSPSMIMATALRTEPLASTTAKHEAEHHQREILGRSEQQRERGQRRAERGDQHGRDAAGDERADGRDRERRSGAALARHLVAVERGHHRGRFARYVDQDRRGRAAILGAVVDAGQHDQRADRRQSEGDRQQHRDRRERARRPGKTPISVPTSAPIRQNTMFIGESATAKPCARLTKRSIARPLRTAARTRTAD